MKKIIYTLWIIVFFAGCAKEKVDDTPNNPTITLADNTIWIDEPTNQVLTAVDSSKLIFNGNTQQLQNLKAGNIVVSGIAPNAPYGYLRKISAVQQNGNQFIITTTEVPFTEAFKELHVNHTKNFGLDDTLAGKKESLQFVVDFDEVVVYDGGSPTKRVTLNGSLSFAPSISVAIDINSFKLDYAKIEAAFETTIEQELTLGGSLGSFSKKTVIFQKPLTPFTIPLTPIVIVPFLKVSIGANGAVSVQIDASSTHNNTVSAFISYENEVWQNGYSQTNQNTFSFNGLSGTASAKTFIEPAMDFKFYGSNWAKGTLYSQGYLKFDGTFSPNTCTLKAGINGGAAAKLSIFGTTLAEVDYPEIFKYEKLLYTCPASNTPGYNCVSGTCIYVNDGAQYASMNACQASCSSSSPGYNCVSGSCTYVNNNAQYATLVSCQTDCSTPTPGYVCSNGVCQYVSDGADYSSITDCEDNCTPPTNSCSGVAQVPFDGFTYKTVSIGNQCWLKENLTTTKYADGSLINYTPNNSAWNQNNITGAWARYNDSIQYEQEFGKLYNWYAVADPRNVCPSGWHVPTDAEWSTLITFAGGTSAAGAALKESGSAHWITAGGNDQFGFSALPGGYRTEVSVYTKVYEAGWWWSSTGSLSNAKMMSLNHDVNSTNQLNTDKRKGLSIRCIKD